MLCPHPEEPRSGVSKDGNTVLFSILRDAAKRPLLRMRSSCSLKGKESQSSDLPVSSSPLRKNISVPIWRKSLLYPRPSRPTHKGRFAIVTNVGRGCDGRRCAFDEMRRCGRRSRVVLTPRRWRQVCGGNFAGDGGKQARSPRRARRKPLKPLRREGRVFR